MKNISSICIALCIWFCHSTTALAQPFAYVGTGSSTSTVVVIDIPTNTVVATVSVGNSVYYIAITPDGASAYVVLDNAATVSVIATTTNTVVAHHCRGHRTERHRHHS